MRGKKQRACLQGMLGLGSMWGLRAVMAMCWGVLFGKVQQATASGGCHELHNGGVLKDMQPKRMGCSRHQPARCVFGS
jgi:hypothetical protein